MRSLRTYTEFVRTAITVLFLMASSGFTDVLHSCLMESRTCCEVMTVDGTMPSENSGGSSGRETAISGTGCCSDRIVGGLSNMSALTEKNTKSEAQRSVLFVFVPENIHHPLTPATALQLDLRNIRNSSPPQTEKYIFNAALLI